METGRERMEKAADALMYGLNVMGVDLKTFVTKVTRDHRTLQQSAGEAFLHVIDEWATMYELDYFDARNACICKMSHEIRTMLMEKYGVNWKNLPLI